MPKLGFRVLPSPDHIAAEILDRLSGFGASNLADAMGRFNFMDPGMQPRGGRSMCGPAVTVNCRPGDNLMVHKALDVARRNEVVVVSTNGGHSTAVFGEQMCRTAVAKQLAGIVVDGAIRDVDAIQRLGFAAFSRTVSPGSCDKDGPGEINVPVSCGGIVVAPGDIVVGDADGVVVVPRGDAGDVLQEVEALMRRERERLEQIDAGRLLHPEVDETLRHRGVST